MGLRDKYAYAIQTAKNVRMQGSADERDGKLHFHGTVNTQDEANQIWNAIKTIPDWKNEIVADINAGGGQQRGGGQPGGGRPDQGKQPTPGTGSQKPQGGQPGGGGSPGGGSGSGGGPKR